MNYLVTEGWIWGVISTVLQIHISFPFLVHATLKLGVVK